VDTTDDRVLADAMGRHGSTPLVGRTASGKFHALYRHNGEFRKIRPFTGLPIDILGIGGLVVAVPSRFAKGEYSFIEGSLEDLERLPIMRGLDPAMYRPSSAIVAAATAAAPVVAIEECTVSAGVRNNELWRYCMRQLSINGYDIDAIVAAARIRNAKFIPPLPDEEVIKIATSAWERTAAGLNWFGRGQVVSTHAEVDELVTEAPDAFLLLAKLRRHNWGRTFMVANALAKQMGWGRQRLAAARADLERRGKITCVREAHTGSPALYAWGQSP
jgi:hypothetical protein